MLEFDAVSEQSLFLLIIRDERTRIFFSFLFCSCSRCSRYFLFSFCSCSRKATKFLFVFCSRSRTRTCSRTCSIIFWNYGKKSVQQTFLANIHSEHFWKNRLVIIIKMYFQFWPKTNLFGLYPLGILGDSWMHK